MSLHPLAALRTEIRSNRRSKVYSVFYIIGAIVVIIVVLRLLGL